MTIQTRSSRSSQQTQQSDSDDGDSGSRNPCSLEDLEQVDKDDDEMDNDEHPDDTVEERAERRRLEPYLLMHAYHLPGNSNWRQDWWQYMTNNHPLFGICFHHRLHPLSWKIRAVSLVGSMLFGLALTNLIYLAFVFTDQSEVFDETFWELQTNLTRTGLNQELDDTVSSLSVSTGNIVLWTVGALVHGLYDNTIWSLAACTCCTGTTTKEKTDKQLKRYRSTGAFLVMISVVVVTAVCSFAVMLRAALEADVDVELIDVDVDQTDAKDTTSLVDALFNATDTLSITAGATPHVDITESHTIVKAQLEAMYYSEQDFADYKFVVSYMVELILSYLIYYPIAGTILFSGCLSCGKFQVTGGLPYELRQIELEKTKARKRQSTMEPGIEVEWKSKRLDGDDKGNDVEASSTMSEEEVVEIDVER